MSSVPGPLHAIGRMPPFSLSVGHGTPFPVINVSIRNESTTDHAPQDHERIVRHGSAADCTHFKLPRRTVQTDVGRQPPPAPRTALCHASVVRHDRLRRKNVDCLLARRTRNAVSRMKHGDSFLVRRRVDVCPSKQDACQHMPEPLADAQPAYGTYVCGLVARSRDLKSNSIVRSVPYRGARNLSPREIATLRRRRWPQR
jgi:hypothetical protein